MTVFWLGDSVSENVDIKREIHATLLYMLPSFRNGLWSGIFQYSTWLPPWDPLICHLRDLPDPTCFIVSYADWKITGTLRLKVANNTSHFSTSCNIFRHFCVCLCFSEPPKVEEPEQWKEEQLSTLELLVLTHNSNPVERVSLQNIVW